MHVSFLIRDDDRRTGGLLDDINTFLHFHTRAEWKMREEDDEIDQDEPRSPRRTLLTVEFSNPLDAIGLLGWRSLYHRGRRS